MKISSQEAVEGARMRRWWSTLKQGEQIALLGLLVTLFIGFVGAFPAYLVFFQDRDSDSISVSATTSLTPSVTDTSTGKDVSSGSSASTTVSTSGAATTCSTSLRIAASPQVRNCGPLVIGYLYAVNLDSLSRNWDARSESTDDGDFYFNGGLLVAFATTDVDFALLPVPENTRGSSYEACSAVTGFVRTIDLTQLDPGATICVRTSQRRISLLRLDKRLRGAPPENAAFTAVTWEQQTP
jgi:hypothetical protein